MAFRAKRWIVIRLCESAKKRPTWSGYIYEKKLGFIVLGLAACVWIISPFMLLPVFGVSGWFVTAFVVLGEVFFVLAIFLLGNEYKQKIKDKIVFFYRKTLDFIKNL